MVAMNVPDADTAPRRGRPPGSTGEQLLDVAREEFLVHGYTGTTMEAVARRARVSKNSLYRDYPSKAELYAAVVTDWVRRGRHAMRPHLDALERAVDTRQGLTQFAHILQDAVLSPAVLQMRSLVAAEASRSPAAASAYVAGSWEANLRAFARTIALLMDRGSISPGDPAVAAEQFTWLAVGAPLNRLTLTAGTGPCPAAELARVADEAVDTFLARFSPTGP